MTGNKRSSDSSAGASNSFAKRARVVDGRSVGESSSAASATASSQAAQAGAAAGHASANAFTAAARAAAATSLASSGAEGRREGASFPAAQRSHLHSLPSNLLSSLTIFIFVHSHSLRSLSSLALFRSHTILTLSSPSLTLFRFRSYILPKRMQVVGELSRGRVDAEQRVCCGGASHRSASVRTAAQPNAHRT
jgi:hypothetical protein